MLKSSIALRVEAYDFEIVSIYMFMQEKFEEHLKEDTKRAIKEAYSIIKDMDEHEHYVTNVKCPFLVDSMCSIYPVRPISCAGYNSASEEACKLSYDNPACLDGVIPQDPQIAYLRDITHSLVRTALKKEDKPMLELISSINKIIDQPTLITRWRQNGALPQ
ncbi:hypothetical protein XBO1_2290034 [Xenorhabdus bovienii str. oregonense]|uniref:YkgJ family cysteine cluster protein n=1 Tax=Xenorhabdus bovienii str. oregonense TaxID=1398202 RepID=A0A077NWG1_XENBV|nr:YkgJ family cysteine cluster protein [Xenorhabdus bovienii]CDH06497.1 hypothetical protein XBO1_2290034 [Xenorhabdus bovienii str. oregonense]